MIKKIAISIGVLFSFLLIFLFGFDKINVLAYSDIGNALGSYPVKLDIENYDTFNLLDLKLTSTSSNGITYSLNENGNLVLNGTATGDHSFVMIESLTLNGFYYFRLFNKPNYHGDIGLVNGWSMVSTSHLTPFTYNGVIDKIWFYNLSGVSFNNEEFELTLTKGVDAPYYAPVFKFGYNVNYSLAVNNLTSNQVNAGVAITDINGNYLKTGNCSIPSSSSTICHNLNDLLYIPFNIDNNGYVSFDSSLGLFLGPVGFLSVSPNDSGLNFVPVFRAYYNGSSTNNLYFKDRYTFNNLFLSGFNVGVNSSTLSRVLFPRNQVDSEFSMSTNKIINFATDKKIETGIYNYINFVDFINSSPSDIYSFAITTGVSSPSFFENRIYTISFSNFSLRVNGDTGNVSPLPNNPNTINKYNECSAWYDIPCQLGNGLTYVIYEAPIISPVLTFIVSFITMFSSLVSFVDLFRSFGIVFGCFIIYMFINLLHKYSK